MAEFKPLLKKPGDTIRSQDWNDLQEEVRELRKYVNNLGERLTLTGLDSTAGKGYNLNEVVPGENKSYGVKTMGLITKQWVPAVKGVGDICYFGITDYFEVLYYWSGAETGDKNMLDISLEYIDGSTAKIGNNLYINDKTKLSPPVDNKYLEFLYSESGIFYKYQAINPNPEKEVRLIKFKNLNQECNPRIGNVLNLRARLRPILL